jgi:hypothetical protein
MLDFGQEIRRSAVQEAAKLRFKVQMQQSCGSIAYGEKFYKFSSKFYNVYL